MLLRLHIQKEQLVLLGAAAVDRGCGPVEGGAGLLDSDCADCAAGSVLRYSFSAFYSSPGAKSEKMHGQSVEGYHYYY